MDVVNGLYGRGWEKMVYVLDQYFLEEDKPRTFWNYSLMCRDFPELLKPRGRLRKGQKQISKWSKIVDFWRLVDGGLCGEN